VNLSDNIQFFIIYLSNCPPPLNPRSAVITKTLGDTVSQDMISITYQYSFLPHIFSVREKLHLQPCISQTALPFTLKISLTVPPVMNI